MGKPGTQSDQERRLAQTEAVDGIRYARFGDEGAVGFGFDGDDPSPAAAAREEEARGFTADRTADADHADGHPDQPRDHGRYAASDGGGKSADGKETVGSVADRLSTEMGTHPMGFSWRPDTGHATTGIMVAEHPNSGSSKIIEFGVGGATSEAEVQDAVLAYVDNHIDQIMSDPELHFGGWKETDAADKGGGERFYLDVSRRYPKEEREAAIAAGGPNRNNQIAAWDIDNMKEIPTGGTGRKT